MALLGRRCLGAESAIAIHALTNPPVSCRSIENQSSAQCRGWPTMVRTPPLRASTARLSAKTLVGAACCPTFRPLESAPALAPLETRHAVSIQCGHATASIGTRTGTAATALKIWRRRARSATAVRRSSVAAVLAGDGARTAPSLALHLLLARAREIRRPDLTATLR